MNVYPATIRQSDGSISTHGPYYGQVDLYWADDRRMMKLEKTQQRQELYCFLIFFAFVCTAMVLWLCSLL